MYAIIRQKIKQTAEDPYYCPNPAFLVSCYTVVMATFFFFFSWVSFYIYLWLCHTTNTQKLFFFFYKKKPLAFFIWFKLYITLHIPPLFPCLFIASATFLLSSLAALPSAKHHHYSTFNSLFIVSILRHRSTHSHSILFHSAWSGKN